MARNRPGVRTERRRCGGMDAVHSGYCCMAFSSASSKESDGGNGGSTQGYASRMRVIWSRRCSVNVNVMPMCVNSRWDYIISPSRGHDPARHLDDRNIGLLIGRREVQVQFS